MHGKTMIQNPDDINPMTLIGSTLGNAYFSGVGFDLMFEAVTLTHEKSDNSFCPQTRKEMQKFKRLDKLVSAAVHAKDRLDVMVKEHGNT